MACKPALAACLLASILLPTPFAWAASSVFRCEVQGGVSYSDRPCPANGRSLDQAPAPDPAESETARQKLERQRIEVQRLQAERERRQAAEESARQRAEAGRQAHLKRCKLLEMKKRWSEEDAANAHLKQQTRARRSAQRKAEQYDLECAGLR